MDVQTLGLKGLRNEQPELSIAQYRDLRAVWNVRLVENLACGCQRFDKNGFLVGNRSMYLMKVGFRQCQKFSKRTGMLQDAQDSPLWTMTAQPPSAPVTVAARQVDFSNNTPPQ
jgi:hypothetical protein